jgi:ComF family protein
VRTASLLFPDDCRLCAQPLQNLSRIPVCSACLASPRPLAAEHSCQLCQTPFVDAFPLDEQGLCARCRGNEAGFDAAFSYGSYEGSLRELVRLFKYSQIETLAKPLGRLMVRAIPPHQRFDAVIPMPMHWYRRWKRGFNQAELLAQPVARAYGLRVIQPLRRVRLGKVQASLSGAERRTNLTNAFRLRNAERLRGKRVLLVDDVLTTGSTLHTAAHALKSAGVEHVTALTLARVVTRGGLRHFSNSTSNRSEVSQFTSFEEQLRSVDYDRCGSTS